MFLENLYNSFKYIKETHILLLEDDVRVLKKHTLSFSHTINGCNKNERLTGVIEQLLRHRGYNGQLHYGACGGCVLDKRFLNRLILMK